MLKYGYIILVLIPIVLFIAAKYFIGIHFVPDLNSFIKQNYFLIFIFLGVFYLIIVIFTKRGVKKRHKLIFMLLLIPVLVEAFLSGMFYSKFEEKKVQKFTQNSYLISTYNPELIACQRQTSIVTQKGIIVKKLYNIGCSRFSILRITAHEIKLVVEKDGLFASDVKYDTVIVKL